MEIKWIGIKLNGKIVAVLGGVGGKKTTWTTWFTFGGVLIYVLFLVRFDLDGWNCLNSLQLEIVKFWFDLLRSAGEWL